MSSRNVRKILAGAGYLAALALGCICTYLILYFYLIRPYSPSNTETKPFLIERNWSLGKICDSLKAEGFIRSSTGFWLLTKLKKDLLVENNKLKIRSGEYLFSPSMTPTEIMMKLARGDILYHELMIPEGSTVNSIAELMEKTTLVTAEEARVALTNRALTIELQIPANSLEGYLFPDTYKFSRPDSAELIVKTLVENGENKRTPEMLDRAVALGMSYHEILTLASIIEKETGVEDDRKKISSVFHNRLRLSMPLQSDPTVIYGIPNFNGNLTKEDLQRPGPYNTYLNSGLPPTPICSPGINSIMAALFPADTDYLYFVGKGDGSSQFSATYKEHQDAVKKYQLTKKPAAAAPRDPDLEAILK